MSVSVSEFWNLLAESRLCTAERLDQHKNAYAKLKGVEQNGSATILAQWLVAEGALSRYQSDVLRGGRSGPFQFDDYRVTGRHRSGRLAGNFSAVHVPTGHAVLLHFLTGKSVQDARRWRDAAQQAEIARRLAHPNLSRVHELLDLVTYKLVVLEEPQGQTLAEVLGGGNRLSEADACRIARFAAAGLARLHHSKQVYGEVRPENIWITPAGQVQLLQPPLGRPFDQKPGAFDYSGGGGDRRQLAVVDYLAPELAAPGADATPLSDIYALGCALYEMLAGRPPFADGAIGAKLRRHANEAIAPLEPLGVSAPLAQVVAYMMAKDPATRYQNADILFDTLGGYVDPAAREPVPDEYDAARRAYESEVARRQVELRSVRRQLESLPDVESRFGRAAAAGTAATEAGPEGSASPAFVIDAQADDKVAARMGRNGRAEASAGQVGKSEQVKLIGYFAIALAVIVVGILILNRLGDEDPAAPPPIAKADDNPPVEPVDPAPKQSPPTKTAAAGSAAPKVTRVAAAGPRETTIPDDGRALWASPTAGPPLALNYLPPGPQIFLALRPAALLAHPEGEKILAALGPRGPKYLSDLKRVTGFAADEIEQVVIGMQAGDIGELETSLVVRLLQPTSVEEMTARWNNPAKKTHEGKDYYTSGAYSYYIPAKEKGRVVAITAPKYIRDVLLLDGAVPPLEREMERMLADTDANRHLTLLFPPKHIFGEAHKAVFSGVTADLRGPLSRFLGDEAIEATELSLHLDRNFFAELRVFGSLDIAPQELAEQMHERLEGVPKQIRMLIFAMQPYPYSAGILAEFPEMIRVFAAFTRVGTEHDQAVLRSYLPAVAAHNLIMGIELAMSQHAGSGPGAAPVVAANNGPKTIKEILDKKTSLSFPRDTLERALNMFGEEIGANIEILGGDLQLDGITKNQSFGIDLRDQPARKILEQILVKANPDKTVTSPSDPKQKLVYVIKEKGGKETIIITTRAQAQKRGDKLPEAFVVK